MPPKPAPDCCSDEKCSSESLSSSDSVSVEASEKTSTTSSPLKSKGERNGVSVISRRKDEEWRAKHAKASTDATTRLMPEGGTGDPSTGGLLAVTRAMTSKLKFDSKATFGSKRKGGKRKKRQRTRQRTIQLGMRELQSLIQSSEQKKRKKMITEALKQLQESGGSPVEVRHMQKQVSAMRIMDSGTRLTAASNSIPVTKSPPMAERFSSDSPVLDTYATHGSATASPPKVGYSDTREGSIGETDLWHSPASVSSDATAAKKKKKKEDMAMSSFDDIQKAQLKEMKREDAIDKLTKLGAAPLPTAEGSSTVAHGCDHGHGHGHAEADNPPIDWYSMTPDSSYVHSYNGQYAADEWRYQSQSGGMPMAGNPSMTAPFSSSPSPATLTRSGSHGGDALMDPRLWMDCEAFPQGTGSGLLPTADSSSAFSAMTQWATSLQAVYNGAYATQPPAIGGYDAYDSTLMPSPSGGSLPPLDPTSAAAAAAAFLKSPAFQMALQLPLKPISLPIYEYNALRQNCLRHIAKGSTVFAYIPRTNDRSLSSRTVLCDAQSLHKCLDRSSKLSASGRATGGRRPTSKSSSTREDVVGGKGNECKSQSPSAGSSSNSSSSESSPRRGKRKSGKHSGDFLQRLKRRFEGRYGKCAVLPIYERAYANCVCQPLVMISFQQLADGNEHALTFVEEWAADCRKGTCDLVEPWFSKAYFVKHIGFWWKFGKNLPISAEPVIGRHCRCQQTKGSSGAVVHNSDSCLQQCCCCLFLAHSMESKMRKEQRHDYDYGNNGYEDCGGHYADGRRTEARVSGGGEGMRGGSVERFKTGAVALWKTQPCIIKSAIPSAMDESVVEDYLLETDEGKFKVPSSSLQFEADDLEARKLCVQRKSGGSEESIFVAKKNIADDLKYVEFLRDFWQIPQRVDAFVSGLQQ